MTRHEAPAKAIVESQKLNEAGADDELVSLWHQWRRQLGDEARAVDEIETAEKQGCRSDLAIADRKARRAFKNVERLFKRIVSLRANTLTGLRVKAAVALDPPIDDEMLATSMALDIQQMADLPLVDSSLNKVDEQPDRSERLHRLTVDKARLGDMSIQELYSLGEVLNIAGQTVMAFSGRPCFENEMNNYNAAGKLLDDITEFLLSYKQAAIDEASGREPETPADACSKGLLLLAHEIDCAVPGLENFSNIALRATELAGEEAKVLKKSLLNADSKAA